MAMGTDNRLWESCWEMLKGYWIASEQFLKGIKNHQEIPK
jgi:hypothetical protein